MNKPAALASFFMLTAVALGAFGAHALKHKIAVNDFENYQTAIKYQFVHGLTLLLLSLNKDKLKHTVFVFSIYVFSIGIVFFSGSLYLISIKQLINAPDIAKQIWFITPLGGSFFMAGWLILILTFIKK